MGGGDLNSKKSWHPNTLKNQERVWKAEQASAEEKKRILELQRERAAERDRSELNDLAKRGAGTSSADDNRLHWMYDKPDKKVQNEDFLLGKAIDSNYGKEEKSDQDYIPAVARRVVGSSMLASAGDAQVDLVRKMREDPLMLVKERERAARAALLNNPLQRRRLAELLRKEQEQRKEKKEKKKDKKDLDDILAAKLNALSNKQIDIATLLANDSSSDSSSDEKSKKKHKKSKKKKHKKDKKKSKHVDSDSESSDEEKVPYSRGSKNKHDDSPPPRKKQKSSKSSKKHESDDSDDNDKKRYKSSYKSEQKVEKHTSRLSRRDSEERERRRSPIQSSSRYRNDNQGQNRKRGGISEEDRAAKLAAMVEAGAAREEERGRRVAKQRAVDAAAEAPSSAPRPRVRTEAHALPESLESRIHSNRHYIQRDRRHMNEHFARR